MPARNGLFCRPMLIVLFCTIHGAKSHQVRIAYEAVPNEPANWTSVLYNQEIVEYNSTLARIASVDKLCDAQTYIFGVEREFWTALKRNNEGQYKWGLSNESANLRDREILLNETQPGYCYSMDKFVMKLKSTDCNSLLNGYLLEREENVTIDSTFQYSDECRDYKLSKCVQVENDYSQWEGLPHPWSCQMRNGESIGICQLEKSSLDCCKTYCSTGNRTYVAYLRSDLRVKVRKVPKGFPRDVEIAFNTSDKITLTSKLFNNTERVVVVTLLLRREGATSWKEYDNGTLLTSVIGVELGPPSNETIPNLVVITFSHAKIPEGEVERKCVFWKEDVRTSNGSWSGEGCSLLNSSSLESTVCSCNHLTSFAVLMQFKPVKPISEGNKLSLLIITYIGCGLSLTGEVLVVLVYVVFMNFKVQGIQIRINLSAALFFAQLVFLSGINATNNKLACVVVAVLLHYFYLASFGWMLLEGVYLYVMVVEVFNTVKMRYLYFFAWGERRQPRGFPIIPVIISLVVSSKDGGVLENYTNQDFCWLSFSRHLSWSFILPVLLVTIINAVILMAVLREIRNLKDPNPSKVKSFMKILKACIILSPLLGLTWVFGLLAVTDAGLVFQYIFTILNSTQGMLIFLLHVVRNSDVRAEIHHKLLKWRFERFTPTSSANRVHENTSNSLSNRNIQHTLEESKKELENSPTGELEVIPGKSLSPKID